MTTACFDFGNTRLKCAIFTGEEITEMVELPNDSVELFASLMERIKPPKTILSSVIHHNPAIEELLASRSVFHKLSHSTRLNFSTPVGKPETIGADRLALAAAAVHFFPNKHNLVIASGSCITYNFINQEHAFIGGSISPGMEMRFRSMEVLTAKLPYVERNWNFPLIGYDTKTNLQSGVQAGIGFEMDGFINAYKSKYDNFNAVLTGGDTLHFALRLKNRIFADPNFLFKGLYALSEINNCL